MNASKVLFVFEKLFVSRSALLKSFTACLASALILLWMPSIRASAAQSSTEQDTNYHIIGKYRISGDTNWDYISIDEPARRLYVSHESQVEVLDADTGKAVGVIPNTPGVHGVAIASDLKRGFTSNGDGKSVTVFDIDSLKSIQTVPVNEPDFILYDSFTKRVFPLNRKTTVLDARSGAPVGELDLSADPEAAASDGKGTIFVNLEDKAAVAVVDARELKVKRTYPIEHCTAPHSLVYDSKTNRLFVGCRDGFAVLDAASGKIVMQELMCSGVDGGGFDPDRGLVFESCAEGVITVFRQLSPDFYEMLDPIKTKLATRTMAFDRQTGKIFLPTADAEVVSTGQKDKPFRQQMRSGTFGVLIVGR